MKKSIILIMLAVLLAYTSCSSCAPAEGEKPRLTVVCTTYPIYLFTSALTENVEGVTVERLDTGSTSCLHDYSLSMADMKKLERADVIAINGAGLEEFLEDALEASDARIIDCSEGVALLENRSHHHEDGEDGHDGHDHGHWDPHYWMDPDRAQKMVWNLMEGLAQADPDQASTYRNGEYEATNFLKICGESLKSVWNPECGIPVPGLITFHDGFQYFAGFCGFPLLASIEEEAGSEASAHEIVEITRLVKEHDIPVIFTEVNGSDATAQAISRETGCKVLQLNMLMAPPEFPRGSALDNYYQGLADNMITIVNGFAGEEVIEP